MNRFYSRLTGIVIILGLLISAGCISGTTAPSSFYVLNPITDAKKETPQISEKETILIGVGNIELPNYLDRPQIVTRITNNKLKLGEFDMWAENLSDSFPVILADNLSNLLSDQPVAIIPGVGVMQVDYRVKVDVTRMDGTLGGDAILIARWGIFGDQGKLLETSRSVYRKPTKGDGYEAYVAAHSDAIASLSRNIAAAIETLLKER